MPAATATPPSQNTLPCTAASCSSSFSARDSASSRAAITPCTDSGSSPVMPRSASIRTYCSAKRGLPPARSSSARCSSASWSGCCSSAAISRAVSSSARGWSEIVVALAFPPPHDWRRSNSSGRAVPTTSSGTFRSQSTRSSTKSSRPSSAQCMSSKTSTAGPRSAIASRNRRHAAVAVSAPAPPVSPLRPTSARSSDSSQRISLASGTSFVTASRSFRSASVGESLSRMPASALTISPSAQNVTLSP